MSEMVERVARSLAHAAGAKMCGPGNCVATRELGWKPDGAHLDEYADRHWREHLHAASFAIEAMREPTDQMLIQGLVAGHKENKPAVERMKTLDDYSWIAADLVSGDGRIYKAAYRAMIDAALGK